MDLKWLHLSDLHLIYNNYETRVMRKSFLKYLKQKIQNEIDIVFITGDITHQGNAYDENIYTFLEEVLKAVNVEKDNVYMIPGNHDINRSGLMSTVIQGILSSSNPKEKINTLDEETFDVLYSGQKSYVEFYEKFLGREFPKDNPHFVTKGKGFNVVHVNTCLIAGGDDVEGSILVGLDNLLSILEEIQDGEETVNFALGHHTINCLHDVERESFLNRLSDNFIDFYLNGHVHRTKYHLESNNYNKTYMFTAGANMVDDYSDPVFLTGRINTDVGNGEVKYHSWNNKSEFWHEDNSVGRQTSEGSYQFELEKFKKKDKPKSILDNTSIQSTSFPSDKIVWAFKGDLEILMNSNFWNISFFENILYVGLQDTCVGLDIDTGKVVWKSKVTEIVGKAIKYNDLIIVPSNGSLSAWDSKESSKWYHQHNAIWQHNAGSNYPFYAFHEGTFVTTTVKMSAHPEKPDCLYPMTGIISINLSNGKSNWSFDTFDMGHSIPIIYDETVYFLTSLNIYALRLADGNVIWEKQINKTPSTNLFHMAANENYIIAGAWDPYNPEFFQIHCLNRRNGEEICVIELESQNHNFIFSNFILIENKIISTNDNEHIAMWDVLTGDLLWESEETYAYPIINLHEDNLIIGYMGGVVKYSTHDMTKKGHIESSEKKYISEPIMYNDTVFVSCTDGYVYALKF